MESVRAEVVGRCELFGENLILGPHRAESLPRSPEGMASFLDAAGPVSRGRAGAILNFRAG